MPAAPWKTIGWRDGAIEILDQTLLPHEQRTLRLTTVDELIEAIRRLAIRGAPALGIAGAMGAALAARNHEHDRERLHSELGALRAARPTAVNLARGVDELAALLDGGAAALERRALELLADIGRVNRALSERGADYLAPLRQRPLRLHTHCNTGALACVEWGTGLGVVRSLHERGRTESVLVDEARPLLQGSRLTTWELRELGIQHRLVCDGAGPAAIAQGLVDAVVVGADRIAANGDVANKVGTYGLALAARRAGIPMLVAAPESTIDLATPSGAGIELELRDGRELTELGGQAIAPRGTETLNIAFDVTPAELVSAIVTERRLIEPQLGQTPMSHS